MEYANEIIEIAYMSEFDFAGLQSNWKLDLCEQLSEQILQKYKQISYKLPASSILPLF